MRVHRLCPHLEAHDNRYHRVQFRYRPSRAPQRREHVISPISHRMAQRDRTEPPHIKREYGQRWNRESPRSGRRPELALIWRKMSDALVPPNPKELDRTTSMLRLFE